MRIERWSLVVAFLMITFPVSCISTAHAPQVGPIARTIQVTLDVDNITSATLRVYALPSGQFLGEVRSFTRECLSMPSGTENLYARFDAGRRVASEEIREQAPGWLWRWRTAERDAIPNFWPAEACD